MGSRPPGCHGHANGRDSVISTCDDLLTLPQIAASISTGEECFLDRPEWAEVFNLGHGRSSTSFHNRVNYKYLESYARLATIVRLLRQEVIDISPATARMISGLWIRVSDLNTEVETLMCNTAIATELNSKDNSNPFETYYRFSKVQVCETFCHV